MNILITGANRGIGLALTKVFLERGDTVFAGTRRPEQTSALADLHSEFPDSLKTVQLDVVDPVSVGNCPVLLAKSIRELDVLINNAGVLLEGFTVGFAALNVDDFDRTFSVNVTGAARVTQAMLPLIRRSKTPRVVNISSGAGSISDKRDHSYYIYGASKAALNHLTVGLAHELRPEKIIVTAISPGWVRTDMGGSNAELSAEESAEAMAETITNLTMKDSGTFQGRSGPSDDYVW
jgi:NAD(P)-dependent dehydrogenase (short-subunit alcohol dehydrogenase family)